MNCSEAGRYAAIAERLGLVRRLYQNNTASSMISFRHRNFAADQSSAGGSMLRGDRENDQAASEVHEVHAEDDAEPVVMT